jgi:hypothetical protein
MLRSLLLASMFAATAAAQCATLSVTGTGAPGTALVFTIDGTTANAFAFVAIGDTQGSTSIQFGPLGTLSLGLAVPFVPVPVGPTDSNGDASLTINVPAQFPGSLDLFAQGITIGFTPPSGPPTGPGIPSLFSFCSTNVVAFHVGN